MIGLLILSKVVSLVFGFKRRMQGKNSGQRTTYSSQNYQSNPRQEETTDSYSTQGDVPVRQRKRFSIKTKGNTWNSKKSNKSSSSLSEEIFHQPGTFIGQHSFHDHGLRMQGLRCIALVTSFLVFCTETRRPTCDQAMAPAHITQGSTVT